MSKIRVLVVDDSALVRKLLTEILSSDPDIEVVGSAPDPFVAREKIKQLNPDVMTLDVEMPRMDGITFLSNVMRLRPMPVVMVSTLTEQGAEVTLDALEYGAVDYVTKPKIDLAHSVHDYTDEIVRKVKMASKAKVRPISRERIKQAANDVCVPEKHNADVILKAKRGPLSFQSTEQLLAIGASTGGTEAIKDVLMNMPATSPGTVITQHIPAAFSASFARRMDSLCAMSVCEARDGQPILPGHAYIAPGSHHLLVKADGARFICQLSDGPPVNRHKPSVDVMFRSVAQNIGKNAIGVILTGMGDDGARGLKEMQEAGAPTMAQDENTSVVWGMPGEAVKLGAADQVLPLGKVAGAIQKLIRK